MDRMKENLKPLFTDMTWGAGGSTAELSLELAQKAHDSGHVGKTMFKYSNSLLYRYTRDLS